MNKRIDLGGSGPSLQLIHANAYTPECYTTFLEGLTSDYSIHLYRQRPLWPNESPKQLKHWKLFADDLIQMMDDSGDQKVIGIGHSLGGIATWLASIKRPDLFSKIILIDPVIIPYWPLKLMSIMPRAFNDKIFPIVKIAQNRRNEWDSKESVRQHLGSKKVYQRFHPKVFDDFLDHAIRKRDDDKFTLSYPREWEAKVYATGPNLWSIMKSNVVPVHIIKAQYSDVITSNSWDKIQKRVPNGTFYEMPRVGHLIPFEKPYELADHIREVLKN